MKMKPRFPLSSTSLLQRIAFALAAMVFAVSALVLAIGAVAFGLVFALGVAVWALLRGRKPGGIRFYGMKRPFGRAPSAPDPAKGEVVDVQVRELSEDRQEPKG